MADTEQQDSRPLDSQPLYFEAGASWYWLLAGPVAGLMMMLVQFRAGVGFQPFVPTLFLVLVSGMLAVQVKAGRIHTSVELTETSLREGTEVLAVDEIEAVFPEPEYSVKAAGFMEKWQGRTLGVNATGPLEKWQTSRSLGELSGVPRSRTPIGLRLTGGRLVQAWARHPEALRAQLTQLIEARQR